MEQGPAPPHVLVSVPAPPAVTSEPPLQQQFSASEPALSNLIVNYIPPTYNETKLRQLFAAYGEVESCRLMLDKISGQSMGYGFIKFKTSESANRAMTELNGRPLDGKILKVSLARPSTAHSTQANLYVAGFPSSYTTDQLVLMFSPYGRIVDSKILSDLRGEDRDSGAPKGVGFVRFEHKPEAENAISALNGMTLPGMEHPLKVKFADTNDEKMRKRNRIMMPGGGFNRVGAPVAFAPYGSGYSAATPAAAVAATVADYYAQYAAYYGGGTPAAVAAVQQQQQQLQLQQQQQQQQLVAQMPVAHAAGFTFAGATNPPVFVYNLPGDTDESLVYRLFGSYGAIVHVKVVKDPVTGQCKGYAFITFARVEDATMAIAALNGSTLRGKVLQVSFKTAKNR